jgi:hypothetical protein
MWCASFQPVAWSFAAKILMPAATACWWWWLAPGLPFSSWFSSWWLVLLLLVQLLVACPSPLGLTLELQFYSMVLLDDVLVCLWCCERTMVFFVMVECWSNESCLLWPCSSTPAAGSIGYCGATSSSFSALWLSCLCAVCLYASLCWSDPSLGRAVKLFGTQVLCTPVIKRTDTILGQLNSMMKMAWCLPKSESNTI